MSGTSNVGLKPPGWRDRLRNHFQPHSGRPSSRSPSPTPPSASTAASVPSLTTAKIFPPSKATTPVSLSQEIAYQALRRLSDHQRTVLQNSLPSPKSSPSDILHDCLTVTKQKQQDWNDNRWTATIGTHTITFKEAADKIIHWLDRFKAAGDVAVNADPLHAGLPWAGIRLVLEIALVGSNTMAATVLGCEIVMYLVHRLKVYVDFLSRLCSTPAQANFKGALIDMYALVLAFLADALERYQHSTFRQGWNALWRDHEVASFEQQSHKLATRLEIEASNCDRALAEQDRVVHEQAYQKLQQVLHDIAQIHAMRTTLDRVERKIDLKELKMVPGATFDAYDQSDKRHCHPGTRVDLIQTIQDWAQQTDGKSIFWLNGKAGTGKSTISQTVAHWLATQATSAAVTLGGSFFFKRGESDRGSGAFLFPMLAHQLARKISGLDVLLAQAVRDDPDITSKLLSEQFNKLLRDPLGQLLNTHSHSRYVIVLDALDECNHRDIGTILRLWSTLPHVIRDHVRLFLTSRPDLPVIEGFAKMLVTVHIDLDLQDVPRSVIEEDIKVFLRLEFNRIRDVHNLRPLSVISLPDDWPGETRIDELAEMAVPLFIVAATICSFVSHRNSDPRKRLQRILDDRQIGTRSQMAQIYLPVLQQMAADSGDTDDDQELHDEFRTVVGAIITLAEPLSRLALAALLGVEDATVALRVQSLYSVLEVPPTVDGLIRPHHLSFGEFLTSSEPKLERFRVNPVHTHDVLWRRCLQVLSSPGGLEESVCHLSHPGHLRADVTPTQVDEYLPLAVRYACRYWVYHIEHSHVQVRDEDEVHQFLQVHFLHWLEALSLLDRLADAIALVTLLRSRVAKENSGLISAFLEDAWRFILANRYVGEMAPLQLYSSAVIFAPQESIIRKFCGRLPLWIRQKPITPSRWSQDLQKLEGHTDSVSAVAFSPDGSLLASASWDQTVRLWQVSTGQEVQKLKGHTGHVYAIAFSPDGSLLASASFDRTVRLWQVSTGHEVQKISDVGYIPEFAFSPDNTTLKTEGGEFRTGLSSTTVHPSVRDTCSEYTFKHDWIEHQGHRLLWLPQEYRTRALAIRGDTIGIGQNNGCVTLLALSYP